METVAKLLKVEVYSGPGTRQSDAFERNNSKARDYMDKLALITRQFILEEPDDPEVQDKLNSPLNDWDCIIINTCSDYGQICLPIATSQSSPSLFEADLPSQQVKHSDGWTQKLVPGVSETEIPYKRVRPVSIHKSSGIEQFALSLFEELKPENNTYVG